MKRLILLAMLLGTSAELLPQSSTTQRRLPNGRLQSDAILEDDYKKSLKDATELVELANDLKAEIEKNKQHVLSVKSVRTAERIEKLIKRIRGRMKRY